MPESIIITLDGSDPESDNGRIDISIDDYTADPDGSQDVTFVDGGNWTSVVDDLDEDTPTLRLEKMGKDDDEPDTFRFDLSTFDERFDIIIKSEGPEDTFIMSGATSYSEIGGVYTINYQGSDGANYVVVLDPGDAAVSFNCFTQGTPIETPDGPVDVADLNPGDLVVTKDNGAQPIKHVLSRTAVFRDRDSSNKPILFSRGCLGEDSPSRDLALSPQHRILLSGPLCEEMFGASEVLAPAKGLLGLPGVRQKKGVRSVDYINLVLERHEIVMAAEHPCETLLAAPYTLSTLPEEHREILAPDLPELKAAHADPARPLLTVNQAKRWVKATRYGFDWSDASQSGSHAKDKNKDSEPSDPFLDGDVDTWVPFDTGLGVIDECCYNAVPRPVNSRHAVKKLAAAKDRELAVVASHGLEVR